MVWQKIFWNIIELLKNKDASNEELRKRFREFSLRADKMLLDDWEERTDERRLAVKKILREVIKEKEGAGLLNFLRAIK